MGYIVKMQEFIRCDVEGCDNEYAGPMVSKPQNYQFPENAPKDWHDLGELGLMCPSCYADFMARGSSIIPKKKKYELS